MRMTKGKAYIPFRFRLSPIKKMAMFHFHKDPDEEYVAFELHYIDGEPYGKGFRVLAWRTDGYRDSYIEEHLTMSEDEALLSVGGKGLKERYKVTFDEVYFEQKEGQLDVGFVFSDKNDRRVALYVDEKVERNSQPLTWLPSVGNHTVEPHSMPFFFLYDFDFARKKGTEIFLSIDGVQKKIDPFAFPKDFQARFYVEFSTNTVVTNFNEAGKHRMPEVEIDEEGVASLNGKVYQYELYDDLYHLKRITLQHETHPVEVEFEPSFPNHAEVEEAMPKYGEFTIRPSGEAGTLNGKYNVIRQKGKAIISLNFPESWQTPKGANYERVINSMTPNIKTWYKTYQCTQVVDLENFDTEVTWNRIDPDRRQSY